MGRVESCFDGAAAGSRTSGYIIWDCAAGENRRGPTQNLVLLFQHTISLLQHTHLGRLRTGHPRDGHRPRHRHLHPPTPPRLRDIESLRDLSQRRIALPFGRPGKPIAQVARDVGLNEGALGDWVAKDWAERDRVDGLSSGDVAEMSRPWAGKRPACRHLELAAEIRPRHVIDPIVQARPDPLTC